MQRSLFISGLVWCITSCFAKADVPRPSFPDVFQTEIEGTFVQENAVVEIDVTMFYDRTNNRAALFVTKGGDESRYVYNFDSDESLVIDGNGCDVQEIPEHGFFPFTTVDGKKKMSAAEEALFFSKSKLDSQILNTVTTPILVYKTNLDIPQYGKSNCDITHIFSKPDFALATCREGLYCNSTLMSMSVTCKNTEGRIDVDHSYRFSRFKFEIEDDLVFSPPPGVHCAMRNKKTFPGFPSYFSFSFDIMEKFKDLYDSAIFNAHKKVWYDSEHKIIRIDEFNYKGWLYSSRVLDLNTEAAFTIIANATECLVSRAPNSTKLDEVTGLPRAFFYQYDSTTMTAVYVGKRKVNGLQYEVWSLSWQDKESEANIVEDVYFLEVSPNKSKFPGKNMRLKISHVNMYFYERTDVSENYELTLLKYFSINNFRSSPKEWAAFDIATCFRRLDKIDFVMKIEGPTLIKESSEYKEVIQLLYDRIIAVTNVSILRISELSGIFDGTDFLGVRGSIIDNSEFSGWPAQNGEPGMNKTFYLMKKAIEEDRLTVMLEENDTSYLYDVTKLNAVQVTSGEFPKPTLPDVFQTDIEGTFVQDSAVVVIQASMFYDRQNNRAALIVTEEGVSTKAIYDFGRDEKLSINGNDCSVEEITPDQFFFKFTSIDGKKQLFKGNDAFYFTDSELETQILPENAVSVLVYSAEINLNDFSNRCYITHIFSKPDLVQSSCREGLHCNATLMSMTVKCKDIKERQITVDNSYSFSRFKAKIEDESAFQIPPGIHCGVKNTKPFPNFPKYFSFTFDIFEKPTDSGKNTAVFGTHKEVWYDAEYKILRIDEFDNNGLLFSSRIFDLQAEAAFTIIASVPTCDIGPITSEIKFGEITRLPRAFFSQNDSIADSVVYVGKRSVHGLDYEVWSLSWTNTESEARIVEEIYFLEVTSPQELVQENKDINNKYLQISHIDMYTYESNENSDTNELTLQKYFSINNYRSKPKEWVAFDVDVCFKNKQKMEFILKVKGPNLVKGSQSYRETLELLYEKIIAITGVSIIRISELTGIFDGIQLLEIGGSILDNSKSSGWPQNSKEPNMEETFQLLKKAASEDKLSISFKGENNIEVKISVTSVEVVKAPSRPKSDCFSGGSMAAASLALLLLGMAFGIAGYYVFLKKRKPANISLRMSEINSDFKHED